MLRRAHEPPEERDKQPTDAAAAAPPLFRPSNSLPSSHPLTLTTALSACARSGAYADALASAAARPPGLLGASMPVTASIAAPPRSRSSVSGGAAAVGAGAPLPAADQPSAEFQPVRVAVLKLILVAALCSGYDAEDRSGRRRERRGGVSFAAAANSQHRNHDSQRAPQSPQSWYVAHLT